MYQIGTMFVDERVEGEAVAPRGGKVPDVDIVVTGRLHLAPQQEGVLGRFRLLVVGLLDRDVLDLEAEDYSPDETER